MRSVFGGLLLGLGVLIGGLSGLCTLFLGAATILDPSTGPDNYVSLPLVLIVGGIPFLVGLGLFFAGRALLRSGARAAPVDAANTAAPEPEGSERP